MPFEATPEQDRILQLAAEQMAQRTIESVSASLRPGGEMYSTIESEAGDGLYLRLDVSDLVPFAGKFKSADVLVDLVTQKHILTVSRGVEHKANAFMALDTGFAGDWSFWLAVAVGEDHSGETTEELAFSVLKAFQSKFSSIVHEYIHLLDFIRADRKQGSTPGAAYMDDPFEFNAWFQQGAHEFLYKLHDYHGKMQEEPRIASDFAQFWFQAALYSYAFARAQAELTGKWARKFRSRLYQFYMHLRETYPTVWSVRPAFDHPKMQERAAYILDWQKKNAVLP